MRKVAVRARALLGALWLSTVSGVAFAQAQSATLGQITSAANNGTDKSMAALQLMYGSIVSNPLAGGGGSGSSGGMIAQVAAMVNACILAVGVVWALYHFGSAMIATAQDGEFLGQRKSSPWYVVRMGAGFTGLVPMFGGYSGAQVIMLWGTMIGVGIANLTMSAAVAVLAAGGTMVAQPAAPNVTSLARTLFEANLCAQAANQALESLPSDAGVSADPSESFSQSGAAGKVVLMNRNGLSCGGAQIDSNAGNWSQSPEGVSSLGLVAYVPDTQAVASSLVSAQQSALNAMQTALASAAASYVSAVNGGQAPVDPMQTINDAASSYQQAIQAAVSSNSGTISGIASTLQSNLARDGWIMLGSWYQSFAMANSQLSNSASTVGTAVPPTNLNDLPYPELYRSVMATYQRQIQRDASTSTPGAGSPVQNLNASSTDPQGIFGTIFPGQAFVNGVISITSGLGQAGAGSSQPTNPLIGMKNLGDYILDVGGWGALATFVGLEAVNNAKDDSLDGKLATGLANLGTLGAAGVASAAATGALKALVPFIVAMIITLFFFGAMLSVYLPMLPFIIWFSGVISWFTVVAESVVASPLWAMAHLDGDGEGMGQRTTHGYVFLLNVMLRPTFMVFGFLLGGAMVTVLGTLLNTMFGVAMQNAQFNSTTGIVSVIAYIVLYVGLCTTLCNSSFSLIHVIPDNVFAWIGNAMAAHRNNLDEHSKGHFSGGVAHGSSSARTIGGSIVERVQGPGAAPPSGAAPLVTKETP